MTLSRFFIYYIFYTLLLAGTALVLPKLLPGEVLFAENFWLVFGFLCVLTCIAYVVAYLGLKRNPENGVFAILGSMVLKMLFSMAFALIYSLNHQGNGIVFVLNFFSLYLLFTGFEIYSLLRNLRHQNLK